MLLHRVLLQKFDAVKFPVLRRLTLVDRPNGGGLLARTTPLPEGSKTYFQVIGRLLVGKLLVMLPFLNPLQQLHHLG